MRVKILIEGDPIVWKAPYVGRRGAFSPNHQKKIELQELLCEKYSGRLLKGPLRADFLFCHAIPQSWTKIKKQRALDGLIRPEADGDKANLEKWIEDRMQGIVYENDRQIVEGFSTKIYALEPCTGILVQELKSCLSVHTRKFVSFFI